MTTGAPPAEILLAKQTLNRERKKRRRMLGFWEKAWWAQVSEQVTEAHRKGDQKTLFELARQLGDREFRRKDDGGSKAGRDLQGEREAWAYHFSGVSQGAGRVAQRVWANIPGVATSATHLSEAPCDPEISKAVAKMRNGRAPGLDGIPAEVLKYGGQKLQAQVATVVREMWRHAQSAPAGLEGESWPEAWNTGVVVPIWKKKGKKADKNTWRGITLLSVGTKVLARVVAERLLQWSDSLLQEPQSGFRRNRGWTTR